MEEETKQQQSYLVSFTLEVKGAVSVVAASEEEAHILAQEQMRGAGISLTIPYKTHETALRIEQDALGLFDTGYSELTTPDDTDTQDDDEQDRPPHLDVLWTLNELLRDATRLEHARAEESKANLKRRPPVWTARDAWERKVQEIDAILNPPGAKQSGLRVQYVRHRGYKCYVLMRAESLD